MIATGNRNCSCNIVNNQQTDRQVSVSRFSRFSRMRGLQFSLHMVRLQRYCTKGLSMIRSIMKPKMRSNTRSNRMLSCSYKMTCQICKNLLEEIESAGSPTPNAALLSRGGRTSLVGKTVSAQQQEEQGAVLTLRLRSLNRPRSRPGDSRYG